MRDRRRRLRHRRATPPTHLLGRPAEGDDQLVEATRRAIRRGLAQQRRITIGQYLFGLAEPTRAAAANTTPVTRLMPRTSPWRISSGSRGSRTSSRRRRRSGAGRRGPMVTVIPQTGSRAVEAADWSGCGATSIPPVRISRSPRPLSTPRSRRMSWRRSAARPECAPGRVESDRLSSSSTAARGLGSPPDRRSRPRVQRRPDGLGLGAAVGGDHDGGCPVEPAVVVAADLVTEHGTTPANASAIGVDPQIRISGAGICGARKISNAPPDRQGVDHDAGARRVGK